MNIIKSLRSISLFLCITTVLSIVTMENPIIAPASAQRAEMITVKWGTLRNETNQDIMIATDGKMIRVRPGESNRKWQGKLIKLSYKTTKIMPEHAHDTYDIYPQASPINIFDSNSKLKLGVVSLNLYLLHTPQEGIVPEGYLKGLLAFSPRTTEAIKPDSAAFLEQPKQQLREFLENDEHVNIVADIIFRDAIDNNNNTLPFQDSEIDFIASSCR